MDTNKNVKKGWSWLGFLFMPYYYAGYGELTKGIIAAIVAGFMGGIQPDTNIIIIIILLLIGLAIAIYGGMNAKKELPIKEQKFSWKNVIIAVVVYIVALIVSTMLFLLPSFSTPKCNDTETKNLVKQITLEEFSKQGIEQLEITLSNIRTSEYNKEIEKYGCTADLTASDKISGQTYSLPITYTSQATEDNDNFYVEVFGL